MANEEEITNTGIDTYFVDDGTCRDPRESMPTHISWKSDVEKATKIGINTYFVDDGTCRDPRKSMPTHISWKSDVEKITKIGIDTYFVDDGTCKDPRKKKADLFSWVTTTRQVYESDRISNFRGLQPDRLYTKTAVCLFFVDPRVDLCPVAHMMPADFIFRGCLFSCDA